MSTFDPYFDALVDLHGETPEEQCVYGVVKRTYVIMDGELVLDEAQPLLHDIRDESLTPRWPPGSDYWPFKRLSDVVVLGKAFAKGGHRVHSRRVSLVVDKVKKEVQVFGDRQVEWSSDGRPRIGGPETFTEMEMSYTNAYGGVDPRVGPAMPDLEAAMAPDSGFSLDEVVARYMGDHPGAYPRNQSGKGYLVYDSPIEGVPLPNLEDPRNLLTGDNILVRDPALWHRQPLSWYLDWSFPAMFPRVSFAGADLRFPVPELESIAEVERQLLNPDWRQLCPGVSGSGVPPHFFQEASLGMSFSDLGPGMPLEVVGMNPEHERLSFTLPEAPAMTLSVDADAQPAEAKIMHVVIEPEHCRVQITWAAIRRQMPRNFMVGVHGQIPVQMQVDGASVPYLCPEPELLKLRRAAADASGVDLGGASLADLCATSPSMALLAAGAGDAFLADAPMARIDRDQVSFKESMRVGQVDPTTGRVLIKESDFSLGGETGFVFERHYSSSMHWRGSTLGPGWSHCLEQCLWFQAGWLFYQTWDGRHIALPLPEGRWLGLAESIHHARLGYTFKRISSDAYEVQCPDGARYGLTELSGRQVASGGRASLTEVYSKDSTCLRVAYDAFLRPTRLILPSASEVELEYDREGLLSAASTRLAGGRGRACLSRYEVDKNAGLREVVDQRVRRISYRSRAGILAEISIGGLTTGFSYHGRGVERRCVSESWGPSRGVSPEQVPEGERHFAYDPNEASVTIEDAEGKARSFWMNAAHLPVRVADAQGAEHVLEYDESTAQLCSIEGPGLKLEALYDASFHLADVSGTATNIGLEVDASGRLSGVTKMSQSARYAYDESGRLRATADFEGKAIVYDYNERGLLRSILAPTEARLTLERDGRGQVTSLRGPCGIRSVQRDGLGTITSLVDEVGRRFGFERSSDGRNLVLEAPDGGTSRMEVDRLGQIIFASEGDESLEMGRDALGRVHSLKKGKVTLDFHRDGEARITMMQAELAAQSADQLGELHFYEFERDACGRIVKESALGGEKRIFHRDESGAVEREINDCYWLAAERDSAGRLVGLEGRRKQALGYRWAQDGTLLKAHRGEGSVAFERDALLRPCAEVYEGVYDGEVDGGAEVQESVEVQEGGEDDSGYRIDSAYDVSGKRVALDLSSTRAAWPDLRLRIERDLHGHPMTLHAVQGQEPGEAAELKLSFDLDSIGRVLGVDAPGGVRWSERFDDRTGTSAVSLSGRDARGAVSPLAEPTPAPSMVGAIASGTRPSGAGGRVETLGAITYGYDAAGRRVERVDPEGGRTAYIWSELDELLEVGLGSGEKLLFEYDALGRRISRKLVDAEGDEREVTRYLWDGLNLLQERKKCLSAGGEHPKTSVRTWIWLDGRCVGWLEGAEAFAVHYGREGTPWAISDGRGTLRSVGTEEKGQTDELDFPWTDSGYRDSLSGLHHCILRVYDEDTACYLSASPLGAAAGAESYGGANVASPLGLGSGFSATYGLVAASGLKAERLAMLLAYCDRRDGSSGPPAQSNRHAASLVPPDLEALFWGPWVDLRPMAQHPGDPLALLQLPAGDGENNP